METRPEHHHQQREQQRKQPPLERPRDTMHRRELMGIAAKSLLPTVFVVPAVFLKNKGLPGIEDNPMDTIEPIPRAPTPTPEAVGGLTESLPETRETLISDLANIYGSGMQQQWDGLPKFYQTREDQKQFLSDMYDTAEEIGVPPRVLAAIINFESNGTFNPAVTNSLSEATGLIQFMPETAENMGTSIRKLSRMKPKEQLRYITQYFNGWKNTFNVTRFNDVPTAYMTVLWPAAIPYENNQNLFSMFSDDHMGRLSYTQNNSLDVNQDGSVTKGEAAFQVIMQAMIKGEKMKNLVGPDHISYFEPLFQFQNIDTMMNDKYREWKPGEKIRDKLIEENESLFASHLNNLDSIRMSLSEVYHDRMPELFDIKKPSQLADVLAKYPDKFEEFTIEGMDPLPPGILNKLSLGSLIVFNPNRENSPEFQYDQAQGRAVIVRPNNKDGEAMNGAEKETRLIDDLSEMKNGHRVFVPIS